MNVIVENRECWIHLDLYVHADVVLGIPTLLLILVRMASTMYTLYLGTPLTCSLLERLRALQRSNVCLWCGGSSFRLSCCAGCKVAYPSRSIVGRFASKCGSGGGGVAQIL
jgi:hypothetical protein